MARAYITPEEMARKRGTALNLKIEAFLPFVSYKEKDLESL
jgi:hypothetical protein